jgi:hypothetical protein
MTTSVRITALDPEIASFLAGGTTCSCCRLNRPHYSNRRCKDCHSAAMKKWYRANRSHILKARRAVTSPRRALNALEALMVAGHCLVCHQHGHSKTCAVPTLKAQIQQECL